MDYNDNKVKQAAEVVQSFVAISKALTKFTKQNAASLGLTLQQMGILNTIYSSPETTLKEITEKLQLSKSTVSINVDDLVNLALVERNTFKEDRREIHLNLTSTGQALAKKSCQNALSYQAMILALEKLSEEDIQLLLQIHHELLIDLQNCTL
ncbi:MarR family winged helix-turn-helix transcriptional regulator [Desulfosporosinus sp. OT]|uniref:MarR family winged helix-turn-helix transcriptional regulator n=1 Tax=Desulfosporosinus sp. OT TaxID=913865 RepID=UPI000223A9D3|nr:MarR family winged helix-turn-helix transcriptional regulator [Desulfosporosinus sp. OT]EGW36336.1 marR family protein [Desulfosporosinus sp. OT]